ncbi:abortive infection family protein [Pseudomonas syringae]|uniref:abortive infection family protein n=1 Tax=Pseudomonas syringae TaxID=317 RepID=UPI001F50A0EA|nr:abortive infection family protein [Pseudomonas syringae]
MVKWVGDWNKSLIGTDGTLARTGHGKDGQHRGLQPRHARLAVAAAVAFIDFVSETHRYREASEPER